VENITCKIKNMMSGRYQNESKEVRVCSYKFVKMAGGHGQWLGFVVLAVLNNRFGSLFDCLMGLLFNWLIRYLISSRQIFLC
jgi:hypothetical protein